MAEAPQYDRSTQDVGNVLALEHVNVTVPDQELAHLFYVTGLGFTRDPYIDFGMANMWINVGSQQFHLPRADAQVLRGRVGIVVPDLDGVRRRLASLPKRAAGRLDDSAFRWAEAADGDGLEVTCPFGNRLRLHAPDEDRFGPIRLGFPYVEMDIAAGNADGVAAFYQQVLGAPAHVESADAAVAVVRFGRWQQLRFRETAAPLPEYDGHHVAIYLVDFSRPYDWLRQHGLITLETNDHEYRFQDIVDVDDGRVLATVEHEVRSLFHPMFGRELVNRDAGQSFMRYQRGRDAFAGLTHGGSA